MKFVIPFILSTRSRKRLRKRLHRTTAVVLLMAMGLNLVFPTMVMGQTSGSSQTETQGSSVGSSDMVDLFTGDFNYSIPLIDVEGYPISLNYDGNVGMSQEASWVGLGWNLNVGSITRDMRGLPDDFDGDQVRRVRDSKDDFTLGLNNGKNNLVTLGGSFFHGIFSAYVGLGWERKSGNFANTYSGQGKLFEKNFNAQIGFGILGSGFGLGWTKGYSHNTATGIGMTKGKNFNSRWGLGWSGINVYSQGKTESYSTNNNSRSGKSQTISKGSGENVLVFSNSSSTSRTSTFGTRTYTPRFNNNILSTNSFKRFGSGIFSPVYTHINFNEGYSALNVVSNKDESVPSYGYLSLHHSGSGGQELMDYNRENEVDPSRHMEVLPVTTLTYDLFQMTTGFDQASFRAHRNDVGSVSNTINSVIGMGSSSMKENSYGPGYQIVKANGFSVRAGSSNDMNDYNANQADERYKNVASGAANNETFYFQETGEMTPMNSGFYNAWGGDAAVKRQADLISPSSLSSGFDGIHPGVSGGLISNSATYTSPSNVVAGKKDRATLYQYLTAGEASQVGFTNKINSVEKNSGSTVHTTVTELNRVTSYKKTHHLSEFTVVKPDGSRYVFNVPVYSLKEKEVVFNTSLNTGSCTKNETYYTEGTDNSTSNTRGRDHIYESEEVPAYAHSFLVGAVLSNDYNDLTGNGLSEDDMGSYVKFNHSCLYGEGNPFKWRAPYRDCPTGGKSNAQLVHNNRSYNDDDLGMYTYGEKELWYTHSVEGKNYVAYFFVSPREDLFSVDDENGALDTDKPGYKLDKIVLYSKEDIRRNGVNGAEPLQTVKLEYDYSLCRNYPGNKNTGTTYGSSGKLTLKKIYFSSSQSKKGMLNPYVFTYNSGSKNPDYSTIAVDRWGVYKANACMPSVNNNIDFPYADKNKTNRDDAVQCWMINQVKLPSGGVVNVEYESDDYAYVQNREAMEMFKVIGMNRIDNVSSYPSMSNRFFAGTEQPNDVLYIQLEEALTGATPLEKRDEFYNKYLKEISGVGLYYRFLVFNQGNGGGSEWVHGFTSIKNYGVINSTVAYLRIQPIMVDQKDDPYPVNPIMYAAWQNLRNNVTRALYPDGGSASAVLLDHFTISNGIHRAMQTLGYGCYMDDDHSMVRLSSPSDKKMGGGHRVKKLSYADSWAAMSGEQDFDYGQEYFYDASGNGTGTSNGVAAYEPITGNEENPFRKPILYDIRGSELPYDHVFHLMPIGESMEQAPVIGYSKVTVKNMAHEDVVRNATGRTEYEFYTAKDAPTSYNRTYLSSEYFDNTETLSLVGAKFGIPQLDFLACTQGFAIKKNDMHGHPRKVSQFSETGNEVSSTEYIYRPLGSSSRILDEKGNTGTAVLGTDVDIVIDVNTTDLTEMNFGGTSSKTWTVPPSFSHDTYNAKKMTIFSYHTITKLIQQYGVMDRIVHRYNGSETVTNMMVYDEHTGQILVNSVTNDFEKPVYSAALPAYWYHKGMGLASDTYNNHFGGIDISNGYATGFGSGDVEDYFVQGDELLVNDGGTLDRAWVLVVDATANRLKVIDRDGAAVTGLTDVDIRVMRSGNRNLHGTPMMQVMQLDNPVAGSNIDVDSKVLNASASSFLDFWTVKCNTTSVCGASNPSTACTNEPGDVINPFVTGIMGNWRMKKTFAYQIDREENTVATIVKLKDGGQYDAFIPYYAFNGTQQDWFPITNSHHPNFSATGEKWLTTSEAIKYDVNGNLVEIKDAIGRSSAVLYGYNKNTLFLPVAAADNATLSQVGFDGFEDYAFRTDLMPSCNQRYHFDFGNLGNKLVNGVAHTGRYSLRVGADTTVSMERKINNACNQALTGWTPNALTDSLFVMEDCNCQTYFSPPIGKYSLSAWVKQDLPNAAETYADAYIEIKLKNSGGSTTATYTINATADQAMVDGWQRLEGAFEVASGDVCIEIRLVNNGDEDAAVYFDDVRVHPFQSSMVCSVYDPVSLRLWAQLDDYHFARFYEYDENGAMVRVKQETIDGLKTLQEVRGALGK